MRLRHMTGLKRLGLAGLLAFLIGCGDSGSSGSPPPASSAKPEAVRASVRIDNALAGWQQMGMEVTAGESLALFGAGTWVADGLTLSPRHVLWYRIGDQGVATNFSADTELTVADTSGPLFVAIRPASLYWPDDRGTFPPELAQATPIPVDFTVDAVRLPGTLAAGLQRLAEDGDSRAADALTILAQRNTLPEGFFYLPYLSRSNVWADGTVDGRPGIRADTSDDFGIVKLPLDIPLTEETVLNFDWRYDSLPALGPETEAQFHDYLSIALEFDNGQDLTWMWSPELAADTHFGCPLPWWDSRETHFVLQSGREGLGEWHSHERTVLADYRTAIARPEPSRIVGVWFIGASIFGRQRAAASFAGVSIANGEDRTIVFPAMEDGPQ